MSALAQLSSSMAPPWEIQLPENHPFESPFAGNTAAGAAQQQSGGSESASRQDYLSWPVSFRKPPQREGVATQYLAHSRALWQASISQFSAEMESIKAEYVLRNEPAIAYFFSTHRTAATFLSSADGELKKSFGDDVVLSLEALAEENESSTLYAIAVWRGSAERAEAALEDFDERWWLNQPLHPGITFTYELA